MTKAGVIVFANGSPFGPQRYVVLATDLSDWFKYAEPGYKMVERYDLADLDSWPESLPVNLSLGEVWRGPTA